MWFVVKSLRPLVPFFIVILSRFSSQSKGNLTNMFNGQPWLKSTEHTLVSLHTNFCQHTGVSIRNSSMWVTDQVVIHLGADWSNSIIDRTYHQAPIIQQQLLILLPALNNFIMNWCAGSGGTQIENMICWMHLEMIQCVKICQSYQLKLKSFLL